MRERIWAYLFLAALCAVSGWFAMPRFDVRGSLEAAAAGRPLAIAGQPPMSIVFVLAIGAVLLVLPSALRRIEPSFEMTLARLGIAIVTLLSVGLLVDVGLVLAIIPGLVVGVLLSQVLIGTLLRVPQRPSRQGILRALGEAFRGSCAMTQGHFATTFAVVLTSFAIFIVPGVLVLFALLIFAARFPPSLVLTAPLLFLTFIYSECVRYSLIVRWYQRLVAYNRRIEERAARPT